MTTLETVTIPANSLGTDGGLRITLFFQLTGSAGTKSVQIRLGGTAITAMGIANDTTLVRFDILMYNDNATNVQQWVWTELESGGATPQPKVVKAGSTKDTTGDLDLLIQGSLIDGADTIALEMSLIEYIGRN